MAGDGGKTKIAYAYILTGFVSAVRKECVNHFTVERKMGKIDARAPVDLSTPVTCPAHKLF